MLLTKSDFQLVGKAVIKEDIVNLIKKVKETKPKKSKISKKSKKSNKIFEAVHYNPDGSVVTSSYVGDRIFLKFSYYQQNMNRIEEIFQQFNKIFGEKIFSRFNGTTAILSKVIESHCQAWHVDFEGDIDAYFNSFDDMKITNLSTLHFPI